MRLAPFGLCALLFATTAAAAEAEGPSEAQALFDQGKRLAAQGDTAGACEAFEESQRLDPGIGTLFHVAECDERLGKIASAWTAYVAVAQQAKALGESAREKVARDRATSIEAKVPRLAIDASDDGDVPGLEIARDGVVIPAAAWGNAAPLDPGDHLLEARAPGHVTWRTTIRLAPGTRERVAIPRLETQPPPAATPAAVASTTRTTSAQLEHPTGRGDAQRAVGIALVAAGVVGAATGSYFALVAKEKSDESQNHCAANVCDAAGLADRNDMRRAQDVEVGAFLAGSALFVGGLALFFTAPHDPKPALAAVGTDAAAAIRGPRLAIGPRGVALTGAW
jgi:hypothetical protein